MRRIKSTSRFSNGSLGAALAVRVEINARNNRIHLPKADGPIHIQLRVKQNSEIEAELIKFLAGLLGVKENNLDLIGSTAKRDWIIAITGISPEAIQAILSSGAE
jgi:uncharacterized protein YggU (UPF0235/DUF167 family)